MTSLPAPIPAYFERILLSKSKLAYLKLAPDGSILASGGRLDFFGIHLSQSSLELERPLLFLEGMLPLDRSDKSAKPLVLYYLSLNKKKVNVHLFSDEGEGDWVVFLDASRRYRAQRRMLQKVNELNLIRDQLSTYNIQQLKHNADAFAEKVMNLFQERSSLLATVMVVSIGCVTDFLVNGKETKIIEDINLFLRQAKLQVTDEDGWMDFWHANGFQAVFGLFPSGQDSHQRALIAAQRILDTLTTFSIHLSGLNLGIGIATGSISAGLLHNGTHKQFSAFGTPFLRAQRLALMAKHGQILSEHLYLNPTI
jgi:hypothetical protein